MCYRLRGGIETAHWSLLRVVFLAMYMVKLAPAVESISGEVQGRGYRTTTGRLLCCFI